ncbi:MAG TPA: hypothetical protein HA306_01540 [Methanosarcina sp.]|nr:hypothetical protein [Methanosarcina sp.]
MVSAVSTLMSTIRFLPEFAAEATELSRKKYFVSWTGCHRTAAGLKPLNDTDRGGVKVRISGVEPLTIRIFQATPAGRIQGCLKYLYCS